MAIISYSKRCHKKIKNDFMLLWPIQDSKFDHLSMNSKNVVRWFWKWSSSRSPNSNKRSSEAQGGTITTTRLVDEDESIKTKEEWILAWEKIMGINNNKFEFNKC